MPATGQTRSIAGMSVRAAAVIAGLAALLVPATAVAAGGSEQQLAEKYAPVVGLKQHEPCASTGEPYRPVPVETVLGQSDVVLLGPDGDRREAGADRRGSVREGRRVLARLPGRSARRRLQLRAVVQPDRGGQADHGVRAHRRGAGEARAPVLVLLPLQRLEQQARERLGDDPARLRRADGGGGARPDARRSSATRSTREPRARPGTTRSSRSAAGTRSCTRARARTPTSSSSRSIWGTARRPGSAVTTRAGRPATSRRRSCCCRRRRPGRTTRSPGSATSGTGARRCRGRTAGRPAPRSRASGRSRSPGSTRSGGPTTCRFRPRARSRRRRPASSARPSRRGPRSTSASCATRSSCSGSSRRS